MMDTPTATEQLFARKLLNLTPEERLVMACSMFDTAKVLVYAGISADGPLSTKELRTLVFLKFYGQDFDQAEHAKILAQLRTT